MTDRLQKQARGLLGEIEVGDYATDIRDKNCPPLKVVDVDVAYAELRWGHMFSHPSRTRLENLRHLTPQELLDHGIIDEIPTDSPEDRLKVGDYAIAPGGDLYRVIEPDGEATKATWLERVRDGQKAAMCETLLDIPTRLGLQAYGVLVEIQKGDWVYSEDIGPGVCTGLPTPEEPDYFIVQPLAGGGGGTEVWTDEIRHMTPDELIEFDIVDEIPDQPRYLDLTGIATDYLKNPRPLPQGDTILSGLIWLDLIYIVHSQPTKDGPVVHCRLTKKGREVVEMGDHDAH